MALSSALPAWSVRRSASSTTSTCQRPPAGCRPARETRVRASSTPMDSLRVLTTSTSAWVPASAVWQASQASQPPSGHCRAAANARAAVERPEPGGPVNSQAWVMPIPGSPRRMPAASVAAARRTATVGSWPTRSAHTPDPGVTAASPLVAPVVDAGQLHGAVVRGAEQRVTVAGRTEQLVDEADLTGGRVVAGRTVLPFASAVRLLALGAGLLLVLPAFLGVLGPQPGVLLAGPLRIGVVERGEAGALGGGLLLAHPALLGRHRGLLLGEPQGRLGSSSLDPGTLLGVGAGPGLLEAARLGREPVALGLLRPEAFEVGELGGAEREPRLEPRLDGLGDLVGRPGPVDDEVPCPAPAGQLQEPLPDPLVELARLRL